MHKQPRNGRCAPLCTLLPKAACLTAPFPFYCFAVYVIHDIHPGLHASH